MRYRQLVHQPDFPVPIVLQPMHSARRMRLRFDDKCGIVKLTYPLGTSKRTALAWVTDQKEWVERQLLCRLPPEPFVPGAIIPLGDDEIELAWSEAAPRAPLLLSGKLTSGGPLHGFAGRIECFLKRFALELLSSETANIAAAAGIRPISVSVGDATTRWGSCSSSKRIRYSWRLIFAPAEARRYVVAHEVAHLIHLNHGPEFKAMERQLFGGDVAAAQALLRRVGPRLRRLGGVR